MEGWKHCPEWSSPGENKGPDKTIDRLVEGQASGKDEPGPLEETNPRERVWLNDQEAREHRTGARKRTVMWIVE